MESLVEQRNNFPEVELRNDPDSTMAERTQVERPSDLEPMMAGCTLVERPNEPDLATSEEVKDAPTHKPGRYSDISTIPVLYAQFALMNLPQEDNAEQLAVIKGELERAW